MGGEGAVGHVDSRSLCAVATSTSPPLTKAQWDDLNQIYFVGNYTSAQERPRLVCAFR
jgi:hypothetical protein